MPEPDPRPEISVVVPTYRRPELALRLLDALEEQSLPPRRFEVVVVDDCSGDGTLAALERRAGAGPLRLRVCSTAANGGPAVARNHGWRQTAGPYVAFTDDDCVPEPTWLERGLVALSRDDRVGVVQGVTVAAPTGPAGRWVVRREIAEDTPWFEACNVFYRRDALEATGGFDEEIRWFGEDAAAGWRVLDAGWERSFEPGAVVVHDLEDRGLRWRVRHGFLERNLVELSFRHPALRRDWFWRPWSFGPDGPLVALAAAGLAIATRRPRGRLAMLALLPYLWRRRGLLRRDPALAAGVAAVDLARTAGHLAGSLPHGRVVL